MARTAVPSGATSGAGCGCRPPGRGWSPSTACSIRRPARRSWPPWSRWRGPPTPGDARSGAQRRADALAALCRHHLRAGWLPATGGTRPQVTVTVDLDTLRSPPGRPSPPAALGWVGPVPTATARRLACDATLTRLVVTRPAGAQASTDPGITGRGNDPGIAGRLRAGLAGLPVALGGAASRVVDLGRATRVVPAGLRRALAARDGGCAAPGCGRPAGWCDAHHLRHWADGGPTSLENLVLLCPTHHREVHERPGGRQRASRPPPVSLTAGDPCCQSGLTRPALST